MKKVSIKDIASIVGAAPATVSFVLNGKAKEMRISEKLAENIKSMAQKLGYHPNQIAVSLRTGKSKILGLIVENISDNFFATLARIIEDEAELFGYRVVYCSTENETNKGHDLIRMLSQRQVDGYLITPNAGMDEDIKELLKHNKPLVLMDRYLPGISAPHVLVDNFGGVVKGMKHLWKKGTRNIGFVTVDLPLIQMEERERGYLQMLKSNGISPNKKLVLRLKYNYERNEAIKLIIEFLKKNPKMEAIFFATNYLGITGLEAIKKAGLKIPDDMRVICFDDHDIFRLYPPGITSIRQPIEQIAKTSVHILMHQLGKYKLKSKKTQLALAADLIERGSTQ
jgi:LacI family transcriptional regulator